LRRPRAVARETAVVVFPTPPFWLTRETIRAHHAATLRNASAWVSGPYSSPSTRAHPRRGQMAGFVRSPVSISATKAVEAITRAGQVDGGSGNRGKMLLGAPRKAPRHGSRSAWLCPRPRWRGNKSGSACLFAEEGVLPWTNREACRAGRDGATRARPHRRCEEDPAGSRRRLAGQPGAARRIRGTRGRG
jgi:hypothetical protein